ncbi:unnamed protein product [Cylicostephanus goldi]|uniref:Uncharacterized protein n=1 Tax=Cylicostephanus goldi TaxID=71465 RepID=A0A3P6TVK0_CYLGO|nr:unnamed protein product [Cylicostephanus goldi]
MGNGCQAGVSVTVREDGEGVRGEGAELEQITDWSIENVVDWKKIVSKYYQMKGKDEPKRTSSDHEMHPLSTEKAWI